MWYYEVSPLAPDRTAVAMVSCFPREVVAQADFNARVAPYYARWDSVIEEDIVILKRQQQGLGSPQASLGAFSHLEGIVAMFEGWIAKETGYANPGSSRFSAAQE
jgi:hypothetical protein